MMMVFVTMLVMILVGIVLVMMVFVTMLVMILVGIVLVMIGLALGQSNDANVSNYAIMARGYACYVIYHENLN